MASTGEVACFGDNKYEAFFKSMVSSNCKLPTPDPHKSSTPHLLRCDYIYQDVACHNLTTMSSGTSSYHSSAAGTPTGEQNRDPKQP